MNMCNGIIAAYIILLINHFYDDYSSLQTLESNTVCPLNVVGQH